MLTERTRALGRQQWLVEAGLEHTFVQLNTDGLWEACAEAPDANVEIVLRDPFSERGARTAVWLREIFGVQTERLCNCLDSDETSRLYCGIWSIE